jgi:hypothetical protein
LFEEWSGEESSAFACEFCRLVHGSFTLASVLRKWCELREVSWHRESSYTKGSERGKEENPGGKNGAANKIGMDIRASAEDHAGCQRSMDGKPFHIKHQCVAAD